MKVTFLAGKTALDIVAVITVRSASTTLIVQARIEETRLTGGTHGRVCIAGLAWLITRLTSIICYSFCVCVKAFLASDSSVFVNTRLQSLTFRYVRATDSTDQQKSEHKL